MFRKYFMQKLRIQNALRGKLKLFLFRTFEFAILFFRTLKLYHQKQW